MEAALLREVILHLLNHSPRDLGFDQTRWTLASLLVVLGGWLRVRSEAGLSRVLQRLAIRYRQGWEHLTSPDPLLNLKLAYLDAILTRARLYLDRVVVLWLDELTFYRLPSPAPAWSDGGTPRGPRAHLTPGSNTKARLGAVLNHFSGQVLYLLRSVFGVQPLIQLYHLIRTAYPDALEIYVIQDCWPVHFRPEVCQVACRLGITLVPLPTYSSWRNPIEKLWRWLKQSVLHLHPWAADWPRTKSEVCRFLDRFQFASPALLRYVGLSY